MIRRDAVEKLEGAAMLAVDDYLAWREYSGKDQKQEERLRDRCDRGLKMVSSYARTRATRANEAAVSLLGARLVGLRGEPLVAFLQTLDLPGAQLLAPATDGKK